MATWQHLRSSTANKRPTTSLADGRIAINTNTASPGLFFKDSAGTGIVKVGPVHVGTTAPNSVPAAGGSSGNYLGEQWLDTSVSPAQMKVWNGSTWVGIVADELPVSKLQDGAARQLIQTDAAGTGVEWTSNVDVPGTLDVTSTATFDSIAQYPAGSAGAPTITFTGDTNTGIYSPGADQVAISANSVGRVQVTSTGTVNIVGAGTLGASQAVSFNGSAPVNSLVIDSSGRVGLGISSPSERLHVLGNMFFSNDSDVNASQNTITFKNTRASEYTNAQIEVLTGSQWWAGNISFKTASTLLANALVERMRITSEGRVGIGTSIPQSLTSIGIGSSADNGLSLTWTGDDFAKAKFFIDTSTGAVSIGGSYTGYFPIFLSNNSEAARIDTSGRLLVGTSTAFDTYTGLQIKAVQPATSAHLDIQANFASTVTGQGAGIIRFLHSDGAYRAHILCESDGASSGSTDAPGRLVFATTKDGASSPSEAMKIDSQQRVCIKSPNGNWWALQVSNTGTLSAVAA